MNTNLKKILLPTLILIFKSFSITGQNINNFKNNVQLDYGLSRTFLYNAPTSLYLCFDACPLVEEQKPQTAQNYEVSYYRKINLNYEVMFGLGFSQYRFWEKGMQDLSGTFPPNLKPYSIIREFNYGNISLGCKYTIDSKRRIKPYIESDLIYELAIEDYPAIEKGFALKLEAGTLFSITNHLALKLNGFYKTGIFSYSRVVSYVPYTYGLEIGLSYNF